mgnify:CR=1 FL=1
MKRGQITIFVIIALVLIIGVVALFLSKGEGVVIEDGGDECSIDADCVKATCCHASSCVNIENAPDCSGIYCSQECQPGTLDCGQGSCGCVNKKCEAVIG